MSRLDCPWARFTPTRSIQGSTRHRKVYQLLVPGGLRRDPPRLRPAPDSSLQDASGGRGLPCTHWVRGRAPAPCREGLPNCQNTIKESIKSRTTTPF